MSLFGNLFAKVRVMTSSIVGASKAILVNVERGDPAAPSDLERASECVSFGPLGVYGRPEPPTKTASGNLAAGECEALCARSMDGFEPIVYRDLRITRRMNPAVGEVGITQYGGGYISLKWDDARSGTLVSISAPHLSGDAIDESHYLSMDPSDAGNSVTLAHRSGAGLFLTKNGAATLMSPDGKKWIEVSDANGVVVASDKGMAFAGGIVAGSTDLAREVALHQQVLDVAQTVLAALTAIAAFPPLKPGVDPFIPVLTAQIATLATIGKATTLKASPV
jgi:hypothetical protein